MATHADLWSEEERSDMEDAQPAATGVHRSRGTWVKLQMCGYGDVDGNLNKLSKPESLHTRRGTGSQHTGDPFLQGPW